MAQDTELQKAAEEAVKYSLSEEHDSADDVQEEVANVGKSDKNKIRKKHAATVPATPKRDLSSFKRTITFSSWLPVDW